METLTTETRGNKGLEVEDAVRLYRALVEELKYSAFAMQTLAESCGGRTAEELRRFIVLCRRTRSSKSGEGGLAVRAALKRADRTGDLCSRR